MYMRDFINACLIGDIETVSKIIEKIDVNSQYLGYPTTGLITASYDGYLEIVKLLINYGAIIDLPKSDGQTALMHAVKADHKDVVEELIRCGANLDIQSGSKWTALMIAAQDADLIDILELLLKSGSNKNIKNDDNETAFDLALINENFRSMYFLNPEMINQQDDDGNTWLLKTCSNQNEDEALFLYEKGADVFIENEDGESAYDILVNSDELPEKLQALKERLMLDNLVEPAYS